MSSLEYAQLLTEGKDLEPEVVAGAEKRTQAGKQVDERWNHSRGLIAWGSIPASTSTA